LLAAAVEKLALDSPERALIDVEALLAGVGPLREQIIAGESVPEEIPAPEIRWRETQRVSAK
jgi:hypothetical protein